MKKNLIILFIVLLNVCNGQEMAGVISGNYAGVNSIYLNPAFMIDSKVYLDINFISADVFLHNNYLYLPKEDFSFFERVRQGYLSQAQAQPERYKVVDAGQSIEQVQAQLDVYLAPLVNSAAVVDV